MIKEWKVALLIETARGYGRQVLRGIVDYANSHGRWLFYVTPGDFEQALPEMRQWGGTGIIARVVTDRLAEEIVAAGLPTIMLDRSEKQSAPGGQFADYSELCTDSPGAARMAAAYLLERSFPHYAFVGLRGRVWSDRRERSFCERIAADGFEVAVYRPHWRNRRSRWDLDQRQLVDWLCALPKPVGLLACNDDRGRDVLEACRAAQIRVPEEIAVIGVDNDSLLCDLAWPSLTSVALNAERGGFEAAALLHKMMCGEVVTPQRIVVEPLYVVSRQSTNIFAVPDADVGAALRFIRQQADRAVRVAEVAAAVGVSRRTLELRFRAVLGRSINDEIQRAHLEAARRLLVETDWPLTQIAAKAGYNSPSYFNQLFRKHFGVSATQCRLQTRNV